MSSHHSQKFYDLHHQQVGAGRERRRARFRERLESFREQRGAIRAGIARDYLCVASFAFLCFVYIAFSIPAYLNYIFKCIMPWAAYVQGSFGL